VLKSCCLAKVFFAHGRQVRSPPGRAQAGATLTGVGRAAAEPSGHGSLLCEPSQRGLLPLCLQPQNDTVPACSASNFIGTNELPLCEPSQNGCLPLLPQAHHQYDFPASTSTLNEPFWAITGIDSDISLSPSGSTARRSGGGARVAGLMDFAKADTLACDRPIGYARLRPITVEVHMSEEIATLGGGCFWCLEAAFKELRGVNAVMSGYAAGQVPNPTYHDVCGGGTGHAEVVQVKFDPDQISYSDLLHVFFTIHDPTTLNRQGNDAGTQYRSIILTHSDAQKATAEAVMKELTVAKIWGRPLVTQVEPLTTFYEAEEEHHDYFARNPWSGYCQVVVAPKVVKVRKQFADRLKRAAAE
jgi:peptide-methionine (S)-S-oxide reductase